MCISNSFCISTQLASTVAIETSISHITMPDPPGASPTQTLFP
jgi:hypothetical protein